MEISTQGIINRTVHETLCDNEWLSLHRVSNPGLGIGGYVYSHETRCQGRIVAILPTRRHPKTGKVEYLLKSEVTPCWSVDGPIQSAITGGYEGGDIEDDAVRELLEETGYKVSREDLVPLGRSYASKSADTVYDLFTVDLTGVEQGEMLGDGSRLESEAEAVWVSREHLQFVQDPQVSVMAVRVWAL